MASNRKSKSTDRVEAELMYRSGRSMAEVADALDIPKSTVGRWLKDIDKDPVTAQASAAMSEAAESAAAFQLPPEAQALLGKHLDLARAIASSVESQRESSKVLVSKALKLLMEVDIEAAIASPDEDGNDPDEWLMLRRRLQIAQGIQKTLTMRAELECQFANLERQSIQLQRQAAGLDYSQEVNSALARVMSMGFTIVR